MDIQNLNLLLILSLPGICILLAELLAFHFIKADIDGIFVGWIVGLAAAIIFAEIFIGASVI